MVDNDNTTQRVLEEVIKGLKTPSLFPSVSLSLPLEEAEEAGWGGGRGGPLTKLAENQEMKTLLSLFEEAELKPTIGYNQGTQRISLLLSFPSDCSLSALLASSSSLSPEQFQRKIIVWVMLHMIRKDQHDLEQAYYSTVFSEKKGGGWKEMLANECLGVFGDQTKIAITAMKTAFHLKRTTITLDGFEKGLKRRKDGVCVTDGGMVPFIYNPSYPLLTSYDNETNSFSDQFYNKQLSDLLTDLDLEIWKEFEKENYFPSPPLRGAVSSSLTPYLKSGIKKEGGSFSPTCPFDVFLTGKAGTGKTSFVRTFGKVLERVVTKHLDPNSTVRIVRIPLNATTPQQLHRNLHIKGLSDWSVERIAEQHLGRGGLVLFHFEEVPEQKHTQDELLKLISKLKSVLIARYADKEGHLLSLFTSNYPLLGGGEEYEQTIQISMESPSNATQLVWMKRRIEEDIKRRLQGEGEKGEGLGVEISFENPLFFSEDMRRLEKMELCLSYFVSTQVCVWWREKRGGEKLGLDIYLTQKDLMTFTISFSFSSSSPSPSFPPPASIELTSQDGVFFAPSLSSVDLLHPHPATPPTEAFTASSLFSPFEKRQIATVCSMCIDTYITPGVIILSPPNADNNNKQRAESIISYFSSLANTQPTTNTNTITTNYTLLTESHLESVFGDTASPALSDLPLFLDEVTNPNKNKSNNNSNKQQRFGVVFVEVSEFGQFALREMVERGPSETHRTLVRKEGVLFVLEMVEGSELSSQMLSRSHVVL